MMLPLVDDYLILKAMVQEVIGSKGPDTLRKEFWDTTVFIHQELTVILLDGLNTFKALFMYLEHGCFQVRFIHLPYGVFLVGMIWSSH